MDNNQDNPKFDLLKGNVMIGDIYLIKDNIRESRLFHQAYMMGREHQAADLRKVLKIG